MSAPVRHTCPDIDKLINRIKDATKEAKYIINQEISEEIASIVDDIIWYIDFESELESLRDSNTRLRDWGHELEDKVNELEDENYKLKKELDNV